MSSLKISTYVDSGDVRFTKDLKYIMLHHNGLSSKKSGKELNDQWRSAQTLGLPYDFIINKFGELDYTPTWTFAQNAEQYESDMSIYKIFEHEAHHISSIGDTARSNKETIHICALGDFNRIPPTWQQFNTIKTLIAFIKKEIEDVVIDFHSELVSTSCPGKFFFKKSQITNAKL